MRKILIIIVLILLIGCSNSYEENLIFYESGDIDCSNILHDGNMTPWGSLEDVIKYCEILYSQTEFEVILQITN